MNIHIKQTVLTSPEFQLVLHSFYYKIQHQKEED